MGTPNPPKPDRSSALARRGNTLESTLPGVQVDTVSRLEEALGDIARSSRRALGELSPGPPLGPIPGSLQRAITRGQAFQFGVNPRRSTEFNEEEIDLSLFEPPNEMAEANAATANDGITEEMVDDEIGRMMQQTMPVGEGIISNDSNWQAFPADKRTHNVGRNVHDWDWDPTVLEVREDDATYPLPAKTSSRAKKGLAAQFGAPASNKDALLRRIQLLTEENAELRGQRARVGLHAGTHSRGENNQRSAGTWTLEPGAALKHIRSFDGNDPSKLKGFLRSVETVFGRVEPQYHAGLLEFVLSSKLDDRAMRETEHKTIETVKQLREELEALYGKQKSLAALQLEFNSLQQEPTEAISIYAARAEKITMEVTEKLCELVNTEIEARAVETVIRKCGQINFENGLHGQVQTLVRSRNYHTLHESVNGAIEISKMVQTGTSKSENPRPSTRRTLPPDAFTERKCFLCDKPGHIAHDCPSAKERRSLPVPTARASVNAVKMNCQYCQRYGHRWKECKERLRVLEAASQDPNSQEDIVDFREKNVSGPDKSSGSNTSETGRRTLGMLRLNTITVLSKTRKKSVDGRVEPQKIPAIESNRKQQRSISGKGNSAATCRAKTGRKKSETAEKGNSSRRRASNNQHRRAKGPNSTGGSNATLHVCSVCREKENTIRKHYSEIRERDYGRNKRRPNGVRSEVLEDIKNICANNVISGLEQNVKMKFSKSRYKKNQ